MSYINVWKTEASGDDDNLDVVTIDSRLSTREDDRDKFNSFEYDEWLAAAAHVIRALDALNDGEALVITKDVI
jgi:hypothetical protein